jgi:N-acetylmuramoyl-L-alanine amidase
VFYGPCGNSKLLADELQKSLIQYVNPGSNRSTKKADGIYLMQHIDQEGILVECGFLSNPEEEAKLRNPEYQKQLSCVIAASLCRFLNA